MTRHEATFDIESRSDATAVRHFVDGMYDTLREELHGVDRGTPEGNSMLQEFEAIREATRDPSPGTLTIVYESDEGSLDE